MDLEKNLNTLSITDLLKITKKFGLTPAKINRKEIVKCICDRYYDVKKYVSYTYIRQLGRQGKDGRTFLALDNENNEVAVKIFSKRKGSSSIEREAKLQMMAAAKGISPKVYDYDGKGKYIAMDKLDTNLFDCFRQQNGQLTIEQQRAVISLFKKLDKYKIFHGDPNPLNFMKKNGKWYIIDFGFSKYMNEENVLKYGPTPNMTYMPIGFINKLRKIYSDCKLEYIEKYALKMKSKEK